MTEHAEFAGLRGTPVFQDDRHTLTTLFERYSRWLDRLSRMARLEFDYPQPFPDEPFVSRYSIAQQLLNGVTVTQADIERFLPGMGEFELHPHHKKGAIFVDALIQRAGRGYYHLRGLKNPELVGYGLEGVVVGADTFGTGAGDKLARVELREDKPKDLPEKGIVYVAHSFMGESMGCIGELIIHGGTFTGAIGHKAKKLMVHGGVFQSSFGSHADRVTIYWGKFGYGSLSYTKKAIIHGGDFGIEAAGHVEQLFIHGGTFGEKCGDRAKDIVVYGGEFGEYAGHHATKMVIYDGAFGPHAGTLVRRWYISGGRFGSFAGYKARYAVYKGGIYASHPGIRSDIEKHIHCRKSVMGTVENYREEGERRWKISKHS